MEKILVYDEKWTVGTNETTEDLISETVLIHIYLDVHKDIEYTRKCFEENLHAVETAIELHKL